jgi:DNA-directed RNA polymerase specialized sigma24 family protein|uniref:Uncharacterized protein n=1 Tax=candidate division WOR-3 bacterium TaxID=2052148 RepID=A0A7C4XFU6_UNCW3
MTREFKPGPYNYCDYRCERCDEREYCRVYKENQERLLQHYLKGEDPNDPEVFLNDLKEIFEKTKDMIRKAAEEQGIDLEDLEEIPEEEIEEFDPHNYVIYNLAYDYFDQAHKLIKKLEKEGIPEEIAEEFEDFVWYHTLLVAKAGRLVSSFDDKFFDEETKRIEQEGTIQVLKKGIKLSRRALDKMLNELPDDFQSIVDLIDTLKRLETQLNSDMKKRVDEV